MKSRHQGRVLADGGSDQALEPGVVVHAAAAVDVRADRGIDARVTDTKFAGMRGTVVEGPETVAGFTWVRVAFDDDRLDGDAAGWCTPDSGALVRGGDCDGRFCTYDAVHATDYVAVRESPGERADEAGTAGPDDPGTVVAGPELVGDGAWWRVAFDHTPDGWVPGDALAAGALAGCDPDWDTEQNRADLARVLTSEASVGTDVERRAVAYTVLNRMARNGSTAVRDEWDAYAHGQEPTEELRSLAADVLRCDAADPSNGATHFYSPRSMPAEGDDTEGWDVGGGLEAVPGLDHRSYRPSWADSHYRCYVTGARQAYYRFYRPTDYGPV